MSEKIFATIKYLCLCMVCCGFLSSCASQQKQAEEQFYLEDQAQIRRYRENISVKAQNKDFVTYEYKDVRVDELGILASHYCQHEGRAAYLREILLYRNHLRRATFDCVDLANKE